MSESVSIGSTSFRIEPLRGHENWLPWKRRMLAILRELDLDGYALDDAKPPEPKVKDQPSDDENKAISEWKKKDEKTRTRIELAVSDSETVYLLGSSTAREMWLQLSTVYESKGRLGVLAT
ncbi:hypothetical protein M378DRAFT_87422, partial [Amanita muscaria Koide BX008]